SRRCTYSAWSRSAAARYFSMYSRRWWGEISPSISTRSNAALRIGGSSWVDVIHRCSPARVGDRVFLAAARSKVGNLDQLFGGHLVELAVELALRGGPDEVHRELK